jgi:hypothetical protein
VVEADDVKPQDRLPTDPSQRALALVERSLPSVARPRLADPELEAKMVAAEQERALRMASREDLFDRLDRVTRMVEESDDGVIQVEIEDNDSLVQHIEVLRQA